MDNRSERPAPGPGPTVGVLGELLPDIRRIAVVRDGGLRDLFFALPAVEALRAAYPAAEILLLGSTMHARLLARRPGPVDEVAVVPELDRRGFARPVADDRAQRAAQTPQVEAFRQQIERAPIDLGVQLCDGGIWGNRFLLGLQPRYTVGARAPGAAALNRNVPFRGYQNQTLRALEVVGAVGAPPVVLEPRLTLTEYDVNAAERALGESGRPFVAIHPGAPNPRRRWPVSKFAAVAAGCIDRGFDVVLVGKSNELGLLASVATEIRAMTPLFRESAVWQLAGADLSTLCGVLARASVLVGNDSGPRHVARALGTPTVAVFWVGSVVTAGPISASDDRILVSWRTECPCCHNDLIDQSGPPCTHEVSVVDTVSVEEVRNELYGLLPADPATR